MWFLYALVAGLFFSLQGLLTRHVLKGEKDAWAFSFYFSLIGALVMFPFMLASPTIPTTWQPWGLVLVMGMLIVGNNLLLFKSNNYLEASVISSVSQVKLVWVFLLGVMLTQELFTWEKALGVFLTVAASGVIIGKRKKSKSLEGFVLVIASTFFYAAIIILFKDLFVSFNPVSTTFFASFLAPAIINIVTMPKALQRIPRIIKSDGIMVILACIMGAFANLALLYGLANGNATNVLVMIEVFLLLTLVGEHIVFKEKEQLWVKIIAVIFAICGAILIRLSV